VYTAKTTFESLMPDMINMFSSVI